MHKENPIVFHNGINYDYHFIIHEIAEELERQFTCFGENTEKYITFSSFNREKSSKIDKNGKEMKKLYLTNYSLLIAQDLWQAPY